MNLMLCRPALSGIAEVFRHHERTLHTERMRRGGSPLACCSWLGSCWVAEKFGEGTIRVPQCRISSSRLGNGDAGGSRLGAGTISSPFMGMWDAGPGRGGRGGRGRPAWLRPGFGHMAAGIPAGAPGGPGSPGPCGTCNPSLPFATPCPMLPPFCMPMECSLWNQEEFMMASSC